MNQLLSLNQQVHGLLFTLLEIPQQTNNMSPTPKETLIFSAQPWELMDRAISLTPPITPTTCPEKISASLPNWMLHSAYAASLKGK
jgi:hypothetical protein